MKNILFTSNKVHTTARIGVLFFSLCFSPLINAGNAEKPMNGIESSETTQQNKIKITGVVTDSKGESIIGANVVEKGTTNGCYTFDLLHRIQADRNKSRFTKLLQHHPRRRFGDIG